MTDTPDAVRTEQDFLDRAEARRHATIAETEADLARPVTDAVGASRAALLRHRRAELERADAGLVFGRLDGADGSVHRIGRVGLAQAEGGDPLLLDWRAGAARPFYTATAIDPQGLARRRHIRTEGARVVGVDDEPLGPGADAGDGLVGEAALLAALEAGRTGRMGTAVATLQREQDEIVRAGADGPLVVQGGPGTGKTVVALHRVAYLLFTHPDLAARGVLVLGPSQTFLDYIAAVLPALGETAVVSATCATLVPGVAVGRPESRELAEIKGRVGWAGAIEAHVDALVPAARDLPLVVDGEAQVLTAAQVAGALRYARADGRSYHAARTRFFGRVHELLTDLLIEQVHALVDGVEAGLEDILGTVDAELARDDTRAVRSFARSAAVSGELDSDDAERLHDLIAGDAVVRRALAAFWPVREPGVVLADLLRGAATLAVPATTLVDEPWLAPDEAALVAADAAALPVLAESDVALWDAVADALGDVAPAGRGDGVFVADRAAASRDWAYGHVVVDEAQELSPMQWAMVRRRVPTRSVTAVGDIDQTEAPHRHRTWEQAVGPVLGTGWRRADLTICYRTPEPVMALTVPVLRAMGSTTTPARAVRPGRVAPWSRPVTEAGLAAEARDAVERLRGRYPDGSVGVIAPDARVLDLRLALRDEVPVLTAAQAKGLEWDATLLVDPDGIAAQPRGWNALYVALTRCTQELGRLLPSAT